MPSTVRLYWETVRRLRWRQITARLWRVFKRARYRSDVPATTRALHSDRWQSPARRAASMLSPSSFRFLNATGDVNTAADWDRAATARLWRYNLHYFDDLNAENSDSRAAWHAKLLERWIADNPPPRGTAWEPYPTSLRIVNWIKWALAGNELTAAQQQSLACQADWLSRNIEWHLLGNHLFANAKALVFAGTYFDSADANRWLQNGLRIVDRELDEQVLDDGGQFERSPMYHCIALEDLLDLINLASAGKTAVSADRVAQWRDVAGCMLAWMHAMCHPDNDIALFNDSAFGIAPGPEQLQAYAERLSIPGTPLESGLLQTSGYARAVQGSAVLIADVGEIGPEYLPGHAHADTLSFELSLFGERWIVDPGCSTYEVRADRDRQRGTAAHNTICVDGADSSEVWSGFRVARRARPFDVSVEQSGGQTRISAAHDGYRRLPGKVIHRRSWHLDANGLVIDDRLDGRYASAAAGLLLHPAVTATLEGDQVVLRRGGQGATVSVDGGALAVESASWHPEFGTSQETTRLRIALQADNLQTAIRW